MNELLTSQPIVILTGAGASKCLGKATTFDIYETTDFQQRNDLNLLALLRAHLNQREPDNPLDLEFLLDYLLDINRMFDELKVIPPYQALMNNLQNQRQAYGELYEQTLDFMVDYYGNIDAALAISLYEPFFDGIRDLLAAKSLQHAVLPIFTLNYDEAIETAVDGMRNYDLRDGFGYGHRRHWSSSNFEDIGVSKNAIPVALFKLHGSVSWTRTTSSSLPEKTLDVPRRRQGREHVILYPTRLSKKIDQEPFSTAYGYLKMSLANARLGLFVGTSFRDRELIDLIRQRIRNRRSFTILAVNPNTNRKEIASTLGIPQKYVTTARLSFEPAAIPPLMQRISQLLN